MEFSKQNGDSPKDESAGPSPSRLSRPVWWLYTWGASNYKKPPRRGRLEVESFHLSIGRVRARKQSKKTNDAHSCIRVGHEIKPYLAVQLDKRIVQLST